RDRNVTGVQTCALPICHIVVSVVCRQDDVYISTKCTANHRNHIDCNYVFKYLRWMAGGYHFNLNIQSILRYGSLDTSTNCIIQRTYPNSTYLQKDKFKYRILSYRSPIDGIHVWFYNITSPSTILWMGIIFPLLDIRSTL